MCGIAGTLGLANRLTVYKLITSIRHRGPDQLPQFCKLDDYIGAACCLRIVDIKSNGQPLLDKTSGLCLSMNGEIYNYKSLRQKLKSKGHQFVTNGDTEVALCAYREYGIKFANYLEGMFAIALYDSSRNTLFLIRDIIGIKPLYYFSAPSFVAYSSEMKSFFAAELSNADIDEDYLCHRFVFNFGPINRTLFRDILPVEPGSYLAFQKTKTAVSCTREHFSISLQTTTRSSKYSSNRIRELIFNSVHKRISPEAPWGIFLSGGIDSSILAYTAYKITGSAPKLFVVSDDSETDDVREARKVASFLKANLTELRVPASQILAMLPYYILSLEEFEPLSIFWYLLGTKASPYIKVALCGQGADELFCGYPLYRNVKEIISTFHKRFSSIREHISAESRVLTEVQLTRLEGTELLTAVYHFFLREQLVWFQLLAVDKCTMASGLETRVPYLSKELLTYVLSIPLEDKLNDRIEKFLLREAFRDARLPNLWRRKQFSGVRTIPSFYELTEHVTSNFITKNYWQTHPYKYFMKSKLEMMEFDLLIHLLKNCKATVPYNFRLKDLYESSWRTDN